MYIGTFSNAIQILADENRMLYCDIGEKFWIDVDDAQDLKNAEQMLQKLEIR